MKPRDLMDLLDGLAPILHEAIRTANASLIKRLDAVEEHAKKLAEQLSGLNDFAASCKLLPTTEEIAALVNVPTALEVAELMPLPLPGKDADPELIKQMVADAVKALPPAAPGKDADPELISVVVAEEVERAICALPVPKDGTSVTIEDVRPLIEKEIAAQMTEVPTPKDGTSVTLEDVLPAIEREIAVRVAEIRPPKDGKDADQEAIEAFILAKIAAIPRIAGESVTIEQLAPMVAEQVNLKVAAMPAPKDGVGLAGAIIDRDGELKLTLTDGAVVSLGKIVGERGEDGFSADDFDVVDGEDSFTMKLKIGERIHEKTITKPSVADHYKGVWSPGLHKRGALVTWGGSLWMAQRDTEVRPETKDNDDWKLVVKRGRDGKDFTPVK